MSKTINRLLLIAFSAVVVTWYGCKKETALTLPQEQAHFMNVSSGSYFITAPGVLYKIPLGLTTVSDVARTVNIAVSSPTGAVQGTHYTLNKTSFVIPAGKVIDTLVVTGVFAQYTAARKDTLVFTIQSTDKGGVASSTYNAVYRLFMRGPCAEQEIDTDPAFLVGSYKSTERGYNETTGALAYTYAPSGGYICGVSAPTRVNATTMQYTINNLWETGTGYSSKFNFDYASFAAKKTVAAGAQRFAPGTAFSASWTTYDVYVEPATGANPGPDEGTFTYCSGNILIKYRLSIRAATTGTHLAYLSSSGATMFTQTLVKQ